MNCRLGSQIHPGIARAGLGDAALARGRCRCHKCVVTPGRLASN